MSRSKPTETDVETAERDDEPLVSLENLEVHFDPAGIVRRLLSDDTIRAVDGVSLDIEENDVVALVGESGCGKTTLGKVAVGLQRPTGGSVKYRGQDIWDAKDGRGDVDIPHSEIRRSLQIIHQDPESSLNPMRTIMSSLADPLKRWRSDLDAPGREDLIYRLLSMVGLNPPEDYATRYPHQLSGGEQQRIALARALIMNPDLILADEAVSALDVSLRVEMMDLMLDLQEQFNTSFVFISHNLANARYLVEESGGGRIGIMYLGKLVEIGTPEEIIRNPKHPYTKVLKWATPPLNPARAKERIGQDPPIRAVDVPDPVDPPSGCNFHTRCPEAREACTREEPGLIEDDDRVAACFRQDPDHEYWDSEPLADDDDLSRNG